MRSSSNFVIKAGQDLLKSILCKMGATFQQLDDKDWNKLDGREDIIRIDSLQNSVLKYKENQSCRILYSDVIGRKQSFCFFGKVFTTDNNKYEALPFELMYEDIYGVRHGLEIVRIGNTLYFPWNLSDIYQGGGYCPYFDHVSKKIYYERRGYIDYGALRRLLFQILTVNAINTFGKCELKKRRLSSDNYFSFRVDADAWELSNSNAKRTFELEDITGCRFTWFLDVSGWKHIDKEQVNKLKGRDIQLHCFQHSVFNSYLVNDINIKNAIHWIHKETGSIPCAEAAPFGLYADQHQKALKSNGIKFTSDFEFSTDDIPGWDDYSFQIPIHPSSVGVMKREGFSIDEIFDEMYYAAMKTSQNDGMAILYEHPFAIEPYFDNFSLLFRRLQNSGLKYMNMLEYAKDYKLLLEQNSTDTIVYRTIEDIKSYVAGQCEDVYEVTPENWRKALSMNENGVVGIKGELINIARMFFKRI